MSKNIEILNLTKKYGKNSKALDDISFTVGSGIFGLLGHNGAGKTTLMKAITTILQPTSGRISVCGFDTIKQGEKVRGCIGYLPQELAMYPTLSVFEFVKYIAQLKGVYSAEQVNRVLKQVDMLEFSKKKIGHLSGGMKRRVGIAQALIGEPKILIVDEPTAGLDPEERVRFRGVLSQYAKEGKTVVLSTHIIEDVYQLCDELAVLRKGNLFFRGSANDLMKHVEEKVKIIELNNENDLISLQKKVMVISTSYEHNGLIFAKIVDENNIFKSVKPIRATLEDAYVYCMGGKEYV